MQWPLIPFISCHAVLMASSPSFHSPLLRVGTVHMFSSFSSYSFPAPSFVGQQRPVGATYVRTVQKKGEEKIEISLASLLASRGKLQ